MAIGAGKYGTPTNILDGLQRVESGGNAYAINPQTKAMGPYQFMPETVAALHQKGVKFDPFDPVQARDAADMYMSQLAKQHQGDYSKALAQYGGFKTKDPSNYVNAVMGARAVPAAAPSSLPSYKPQIDDFSSSALDSGPAVNPAVAIAPTQPIQDPSKRNVVGPNGELQSPGLDVVANQVSSLGSTIAGGFRGIYNVGDALAHGKSWDQATQQGAEAVTKTQQDYTFQPRTDIGKTVVEALGSKLNPLNWVGAAGEYAGGKLAEEGLPGAGAVVSGALTAAPMLLGVKGVRNGIASAVGDTATMLKPSSKPLPFADRVEPSMPDKSGNPTVQPIAQIGASKTTPQVAKPVPITAETPTVEILPGQTLSQPAHADRAKTLQAAGFNDARQSAVEGDHRSRAVEYQMSKYDEPAGQAAAKQFDSEKQTLTNYATGLINDAGGSVGTDQASLYQRGSTIIKPIQALRNWFDEKARGLYTAADEKAQGQPVTLGGFGETLSDQSQWTNQDRVMLKDAALSYAKKAGMNIGEDGAISGTALQAETVRKYLNSERTNSNGRFVDALKDSLDDDVGKAAGGPIYDQARSLWRLRQQTINDPKGISSILDEEGTNRKIPLENIAAKVANMPQEQFAHIVNTLRDVPMEIKPLADSALGEIKSHYLNQMLKASTETRGGNGRAFWNGTGVKNIINGNSGKLSSLMSPDELSKIDVLRKAGDILSFDPSYPGASAQAANAVKQGLMPHMIRKGLTASGAVLGGVVLGPVGAAGGATLGEMAGSRASSSMAERAALKRWNSKSISLKQIMSSGNQP
jgi:hypothetical protein